MIEQTNIINFMVNSPSSLMKLFYQDVSKHNNEAQKKTEQSPHTLILAKTQNKSNTKVQNLLKLLCQKL